VKLSPLKQILILLSVAVGLGLASLALDKIFAAPPRTPNPIPAENGAEGSNGWMLERSGYLVADDAAGQIKGYASAPSVNKGGTLALYVSVSPTQSFNIDIYRVGWYGGQGGRLKQQVGPLAGVEQPACPQNPDTGMAVCAWSASYQLAVPTNWTTGVYLAVLTNESNYQNYIVFVVRDDSRVPHLVYKQPVNTYQAYNDYPDDGRAGKSLYEYNSFGADTLAGTPRAVKVSFDRPYAQTGAGDFLTWEMPLVRWLERKGYDVGYTTDVDFHEAQGSASQTRGLRGLLSPGHDEYWTQSMYSTAVGMRDAGVNFAFLGANAIYWQARYESSAAGVADRVLVCYRDPGRDPMADPNLKTVRWREAPVFRAEQTLIGVQYVAKLPENTTYRVANTDAWVFTDSGFKPGDSVPNLVGNEADAALPQYPLPAVRKDTYALLSASPVVDDYGATVDAQSAIYQAPSGAWVFATGTMAWSWALDQIHDYDPRIEQVTSNVLDAFVLGALPRPTPLPVPTTQHTRQILQDGPAAYWRLGTRSGWRILDLSGHGLAAMYNQTPPAPDSDDGVPALLPRLVASDFTIEGWMFLDDPTWNAAQNYNNTLVSAFGKVRMLVRPGASSPAPTLGNFGVWLNGTEYELQPPQSGIDNTHRWVQWALVRNAESLSLYRNGQLLAHRADLPPRATADLSAALTADRGGAYPLKGRVDDVAVFTRALTAANLQAHYESALPTLAVPVNRTGR
jgi:hypothetical protein